MANMRLVRLVEMISPPPSVLSAKAVVDPIDNRRHLMCIGNSQQRECRYRALNVHSINWTRTKNCASTM
jgi:hypothetical protein